MRIAILSTIHWSTPPKKYGPWEKIASLVAEGMVKRGHDVTLYATGDSVTSGKLRWICPRPLMEDISLEGKVYQYLHTAMPFEEAGNFDIIHNHYDAYPLVFSKLIDKPVVTTIHGFSSLGVNDIFRKYNNTYYVSISMADRKNCPDLNYEGNIYHGIEIEKYQYRAGAGDYFCYFGRICADKGVHLAVQLARKMGFRLLMAGLIDESYRGYFEKEIKPYLNDKIQYLGLVEEDEKMELISKARALLHFNTYAEGFGISLIEAMACGTPVVGMDLGSIGEVVEDGVTGFVISDISKAEGAIEKIGSIRREDCRKRVENLFTADRMVDNYEKLFTGIIGKHKNTRAK